MTLKILLNPRFKLQSLIDFGGRYIYYDSHDNTEYNRICSDHMDITMKQFISKIAGIFISITFAAIGPAYAYFWHGIHSTFTEARIPFTEPKSNAEFMGNFLFQNVTSVHGAIAYVGLEVFLSILENAVTITPRLIENDLVHTIKLYEKKSTTQLQLNVKIGNIVRQSIDADK